MSQQQGGDTSLTFSSQYGTIAVNTLPVISGQGIGEQAQTNFVQTAPISNQFEAVDPVNNFNMAQQTRYDDVNNTQIINEPFVDQSSADVIITLIEKLAKLHEASALTDEEFNTKKSELLSRI